MKPLDRLPVRFIRDWRARLHKAEHSENGIFRVVDIFDTKGKGYQGQRIIVRVVDENGFPLAGIPVAFAYDTAQTIDVDEDLKWSPPEWRADVVITGGSGEVEHIQGDVVKVGEPGGVTVYCLHPLYTSDWISGCGMLADHTGMYITFQLKRVGVNSIQEEVRGLKTNLSSVEDRLDIIEKVVIDE